MMMCEHNITPVIKFLYLAQLTLRKEIMFSGSDLIKLALKEARFFLVTDFKCERDSAEGSFSFAGFEYEGACGKELWMVSRPQSYNLKNDILLQPHEPA